MNTEFLDSWLWLIFVAVGLSFILLELAVGVDTGFDLVLIGSAFIIGGLVTLPFDSWVTTSVVTSAICVAYIALGRRYFQQRLQIKKVQTNIDSIVGMHGIVLERISRNYDGLVKVDHEQWRARAEEDIDKDEEVVVTAVKGVTLIVNKATGGG